MSLTFTADEILGMAEQIERNGAKYYRKAAKGVSEKGVKNLLVEFAEMEVEHERTFASMRSNLSTSEQPTVYDPENQVEMYLRAMADGKVFDIKSDPSEKLTGNESPADILTKAIGVKVEGDLGIGLRIRILPTDQNTFHFSNNILRGILQNDSGGIIETVFVRKERGRFHPSAECPVLVPGLSPPVIPCII